MAWGPLHGYLSATHRAWSASNEELQARTAQQSRAIAEAALLWRPFLRAAYASLRTWWRLDLALLGAIYAILWVANAALLVVAGLTVIVLVGMVAAYYSKSPSTPDRREL